MKKFASFGRLTRLPMITIFSLTLLLGLLSALLVEKLSDDWNEQLALQQANMVSRALRELRLAHTREITLLYNESDRHHNHDQSQYGALSSVSDELTLALGKIQGRHVSGAEVRIYSALADDVDNKALFKDDQFLRAAWHNFQKNALAPYHQFQSKRGLDGVRYAISDTLQPYCLDCHQTRREQTSSIWESGKAVGIIEVFIPIHTAPLMSPGPKSVLYNVIGFYLLLASLGALAVFLIRNRTTTKVATADSEGAERDQTDRNDKKAHCDLNSLFDASLIVENNKIVDCNQMALSLLLCDSKEELVGIHLSEFTPRVQSGEQYTRDALEKALEIALREGRNQSESLLRRKNGEDFYAEILIVQVMRDAKKVLQVSLRDLTENKLLEKEINLAKETLENNLRQLKFFKSIAEVSEQGMGMARPDGTIEYINPALQKIIGEEDPSNIKSRHFYDYYAPWAREILDNQVMPELLKSGRWAGELEIMSRTGKVYPTYEYFFLMFDDSGEASAICDVICDISQQKRFEKSLQEAREAAEAANLAKNAFLANMSHEIRTPLNAILGYAQLLQRDKTLSEETITMVKSVVRSGEHLAGLINDVLDMSRIEAGRLELSNIDFDLHGLLDDLEMMLRIRADQAGLSLHYKKDEKVPQYVYGDQGKLRQLLLNLMGNAIKFTPKGSVSLTVNMSSKTEDEVVLLLEVADTGIGIAPESLKTIFDPFDQPHREDIPTGTGLGLSISRKIARLMGGEITVESEVGKGSRFLVSIKLILSTAAHLSGSQKFKHLVSVVTGSKLPSVLVVDDIAVNRDLISRALNPFGFNITEASSGKQAVELFKSQRPDIILLDVVMPEMGGIEATRIIRQMDESSHTKIIAITASAMEDEVQAILNEGADGVLRKPIQIDELLQNLSKFANVQLEHHEDAEKKQLLHSLRARFPVDFDEMPVELYEHIVKLLKLGKIAELRKLIGPLREWNQDTADVFEEMVNNYQLKELKVLFLSNKE